MIDGYLAYCKICSIMLDDSITDNSNTVLWPIRYLEAKSAADGLVNGGPKSDNVALIILHSPIEDFDYLQRIWSHASFHLCADGAANRLHNLLTKHHSKSEWPDALKTALPRIIHGDLDSLDGSVRKRYEQFGVEISKDPDQYSTDFGKGVKKVFERLPNVRDILVLGSIGGRVDQGIGLLGELYREQRHNHPNVRFWLFSEASVSTILAPGSTTLHTPLSSGLITRNAGILSCFGPARISLQGFEWDVQDWPTEMGGQMSTSNHIASDEIKILTDRHVLFTLERAGRG
jgi:thiamine pyrophosphokinase